MAHIVHSSVTGHSRHKLTLGAANKNPAASAWRVGSPGALRAPARAQVVKTVAVAHQASALAPRRRLSLMDQSLLAALWPDTLGEQIEQQTKELSAYLQMARPINLLPSCLLVLVGAWAGAGRSVSVLRVGSVWLMALLSGSVAVASMVANDFFDWVSGVDSINRPDKPLPAGIIPPHSALLFASVLYIGVLCAACLMEPALLRAIIAFSAGATLLYTPLLKRLTLVKTATVASIIALSPAAGALAAGVGTAGLARVAAPCAFVFLAILYRETLMDITDIAGDAAARVWTLPVVVGARPALATALVSASAAAGLALWVAATGSGLAGLWARLAWPHAEAALRVASVALMLYVLKPLADAAAGIYRSGLDKEVLGQAIDGSLKPIGAGLLLLAALA